MAGPDWLRAIIEVNNSEQRNKRLCIIAEEFGISGWYER